MKKIFILMLASLFFLGITACGGDDDGASFQQEEPASSLKDITAFSINGNDGVIDQTAGAISVNMHYTDLSALVATFTTTGVSVTVGSTVQVSGTTPNNFNSPVVYTVTAEDGSTKSYTASVFELDKYQAFESYSTNLDANYTANGNNQVYFRDQKTGATSLVSVGYDGSSPADGDCYGAQRPVVSADGRYVAFDSNAANLVNMPFQGYRQVYVRDMQTDVTTLVSLGSDGNMGDYCSKEPVISPDGSYILYSSSASNILGGEAETYKRQIFRYEIATGTTTLTSTGYDGNPGDACSRRPMISADGKYMVFESLATNMVAGVDPGGYYQIFVKNLETGVNTILTQGIDGNPADGSCYGTIRASISANNRYVVFDSNATNLVDMTGLTFQGDRQIYVRDLQEGVTTLVSLGYDGQMGDGCNRDARISADGSYIFYSSSSTNILADTAEDYMRQIFRYEMATGTTTLASVGNDGNPGDSCSRYPLISADGRYLTFESDATNMIEGGYVDGYSQIYVKDMVTGATSMTSVNPSVEAGDSDSYLQYNNY